jgi:penicillin V acylase-like amidase (Ntn superfamily)
MDYSESYFFDTFLNHWNESNTNQIQRNIGRGGANTSFVATGPRGDKLLARNFDWSSNQSIFLYTHPKIGYSSVSIVSFGALGFGDSGIHWGERYKLLLAPYLPQDGINEKGLGVSSMYVPCRIAKIKPHKPTININEVMCIMLDYAATVEEAIEMVDDYNINFPGMCSHHLVVDVNGDAAVLEYIDGDVIVIRNEEPWQVATNFLMAEYMPDGADGPSWSYIRTYEELSKEDYARKSHRATSRCRLWDVLVYGL